jgi:hypothetical protein
VGIVEFLTACLAEDERIARAATSGPWRAHDTHLGQYGYAATVLSGEGNDTDLRAWLPSMSNEPWDEARNVWADAAHIAAHGPARVLREVDAKRRIVDAHERSPMPKGDTADCAQCWGAVWPCPTLRLLALPYDDRDGYQEAWRP